MRSIYSLSDNAPEGVTLLEAGAIMAIGEGYELSDLTPENAAKPNSRMASVAVYTQDAGWDEEHIVEAEVDTGVSKRYFAYTTVYDSEFSATKYSTEMLYRGYVKVEVNGQSVTLYTDMSTAIGKISLLDVTEAAVEKDATLASYLLVKRVLDS